MSSHLDCYAVDTAQLWAAFGGGDSHLVSAVLANYAEDIEEIEELMPSKAPRIKELLELYVAGESPHLAWVSWNKQVLRFLCAELGESVDDDAWAHINAEFVDHLCHELEAAGAPFDLWDLIYTGLPENIPLTNPHLRNPLQAECGFVDAQRAREIAKWCQTLQLDGLDEYESAAIDELKGWFATAAKQSVGLAFFYN